MPLLPDHQAARAARAVSRRRAAAGAVAVALLVAGASAAAEDGPAEDGWAVVARSRGIVIRAREAPGGQVREIEARAELEAPLAACREVLRSPEDFPDFVPHVQEVEILQREPDLLVYQRIKAPLVAPRDCVLKVDEGEGADGAWRQCWEAVEDEGPAPVDGVVRVVLNEGCWVLEEDGRPGRTLATYRLRTDPGGRIPKAIVNRANRHLVRSLLRALEHRAAELAGSPPTQ